MTDEPTGRAAMTSNGTPVTDEMLARLADKAEAGFDLDRLRPRPPGRPRIGAAPAESLSVRFPPELRHQLHQRAEAEHVSEADIIRRAVAEHLAHTA
ncbi:MAG: ribbon-helix-helix domain-containing protein [Actinomycetota bacterium]|jgi:hypothetical protein|nr:ribbon-helix-helix domain-containing protein [Actinomycetota bacterium]